MPLHVKLIIISLCIDVKLLQADEDKEIDERKSKPHKTEADEELMKKRSEPEKKETKEEREERDRESI